MRAILRWVTDHLPCRVISDGERPYLERFYLGTLFGWRFCLHQFVGSDPDRGLHDHPWNKAYSLILAGWYFEETRAGTRKVRWFNSLTGDSFHRVVLPCDTCGAQFEPAMCPKEQSCWTLFFHRAENVKAWGFMEPVEGHDGAMLFVPYAYTREGNQRDWWLTAPKGREMRAQGRAA